MEKQIENCYIITVKPKDLRLGDKILTYHQYDIITELKSQGEDIKVTTQHKTFTLKPNNIIGVLTKAGSEPLRFNTHSAIVDLLNTCIQQDLFKQEH